LWTTVLSLDATSVAEEVGRVVSGSEKGASGEPVEDPARTAQLVEELVAFFEALPPPARREYEALAQLDRRFGEDVMAERRARATPGSEDH
jgi:hypothetical protein